MIHGSRRAGAAREFSWQAAERLGFSTETFGFKRKLSASHGELLDVCLSAQIGYSPIGYTGYLSSSNRLSTWRTRRLFRQASTHWPSKHGSVFGLQSATSFSSLDFGDTRTITPRRITTSLCAYLSDVMMIPPKNECAVMEYWSFTIDSSLLLSSFPM